MKFFCIINRLEDTNTESKWGMFKSACEDRDIELVALAADQSDAQVTEIPDGNMLYRIGISPEASLLEKILWRPEIKTVYRDDKTVYIQRSLFASMALHKSKLPFIDTVFNPSTDEAVLNQQVERVGGYPVILKASGFSHGQGVSKHEDFQSLSDAINSAHDQQLEPIAITLKRFLDYKQHLRLIVLGDKVVDSIEYFRPDDDFRTNAVENPNVAPFKPSEQAKQIAVEATHVLGTNFGGVDLLIDQDDSIHLAEVNFPCNFARNQDTTGTDIAGMIVDYLLEQA